MKVLNKSFMFFSLVVLVASGCDTDVVHKTQDPGGSLQYTSESMPMDEFLSWVADEEHELMKNKEVSDINYKICYLPAQHMAFTELKEQNYTMAEFESAMQHYTAMSYFNIRVELSEGQGELLKYQLNSPQEYQERISYLAFKMQKDISLVQGSDTLFPGMYHFERVYDVAPFATVMLAFDNAKFDREKEFSIVFNDRLFNKGYIKYNYQNNQLIDLPNISGI